jgi:hypothetical protein
MCAVHGRPFANSLHYRVRIGAVARYDTCRWTVDRNGSGTDRAIHQSNFLTNARMGGMDVDGLAARFRAPDRVSVVRLVGWQSGPAAALAVSVTLLAPGSTLRRPDRRPGAGHRHGRLLRPCSPCSQFRCPIRPYRPTTGVVLGVTVVAAAGEYRVALPVGAALVLVQIGIALVTPRRGVAASIRVETVLHPQIQRSPHDISPGQS